MTEFEIYFEIKKELEEAKLRLENALTKLNKHIDHRQNLKFGKLKNLNDNI